MKRMRLMGGIAFTGVILMLVVSPFPAQQVMPPTENVPPEVFDPGFVPGSKPPLLQKLTKEQVEKLKAGLQNFQQKQGADPKTGNPYSGNPYNNQGNPYTGNAAPGQDLQQGNQRPVSAAAPEPFKSKEGKTGWRVTIPGNKPLATPAVSDGNLYLGGGFGSHEFYGFDAKTGKQQWVYKTGDDGPTAAVVSDDLIAFNTESCELEIITRAGKPLWKKWLGDPLMSMPAIHDGKVYMAYPDSKGGGGHKLACFDLKTGREAWKKPIAGDIITAPVIDNNSVYLTTLDGTVYNFACKDGELVWSEKKNATSSPAVHNGRLYFSHRDVAVVKGPDGKEIKQQQESLATRPSSNTVAGAAGGFNVYKETTRKADYLDLAKRTADSPQEKASKSVDAGVGFSAAPAAANLMLAERNLGQSTVNGIWAFQGSRPFIYKDNLVSSMGDTVKCVDPRTEKVLWKHSIRDDRNKGPLVDAALTPPAIVNRKLFIGTTAGQIICMNAETGTELWRATVGDPIVFQPAVAYGRVFVGTSNGRVYCIETGDEDDHGWMMWGANAAHNGRVQ